MYPKIILSFKYYKSCKKKKSSRKAMQKHNLGTQRFMIAYQLVTAEDFVLFIRELRIKIEPLVCKPKNKCCIIKKTHRQNWQNCRSHTGTFSRIVKHFS